VIGYTFLIKYNRDLLGPDKLQSLYLQTGVPIHAAYAPSLLHQLATQQPMMIKRASSWQTIGSWIIARWCGIPIAPISSCEASWAGLLDLRSGSWHCELAQELGLALPSHTFDEAGSASQVIGAAAVVIEDTSIKRGAGALPEVCDYCDESLNSIKIGMSDEAYGKRWPMLTKARIFLPIADGAAAALGSGCDGISRVISLTVGTSAAVRVVLRSPVINKTSDNAVDSGSNRDACQVGDKQQQQHPIKVPVGLWCYRIDSERLIVGGALTDGGSYIEWLSALLYGGDVETAMHEASMVQPSDHGLQV
jgi:gluconokinase